MTSSVEYGLSGTCAECAMPVSGLGHQCDEKIYHLSCWWTMNQALQRERRRVKRERQGRK